MSSKSFLLLTITKTCANRWHFSSRPWLCSSRSPNCSDGHPRCDEGNPNLILLDLRLADMNGIEVARQLQNSGNDTHPGHCLDRGLSSQPNRRLIRLYSKNRFRCENSRLRLHAAYILIGMILKEHLGRRRPRQIFSTASFELQYPTLRL
jgi:CheY-like chemotaxis protein